MRNIQYPVTGFWNCFGPPSPSRDRDGIGRHEFQGIKSYRCNVMAALPAELRHANQACPPSLPDIWQAGGRRVWARDFDIRVLSFIYSQYPESSIKYLAASIQHRGTRDERKNTNH
ncbi:MAG: hypothetical protein E3J56_14260 [Candidatus Aminicenantes bacterium]|nr:MAG: hypothetical protein E3J56_14260 [Candidatus Aminicenantes bacterium]